MSGVAAAAPTAPLSPQQQQEQAMRARVGKVVGELERLRFDYLHASIGLPLPSVRQLVALARLRPSCLPHDPRPPPSASTQGGGSGHSTMVTGPIAPRVGPLPAWTLHQTRAFGQVFLDRMKEAARAQGLSLDAYALTAARAGATAPPAPAAASALEAWHHEAVRAFNSGRGASEIARACQQRPPQQLGVVEEATVLRWLAEADGLGLAVAWEQRLGVSPALLEAVGVAVEVARALEEGGRDPLALDFPMACLRQLLPDYGDADVLAGLCALRHRRRQATQQQWQQQQQQQSKAAGSSAGVGHQKPQPQQSGAAANPPNRAPLASLPCPPRQQAAPQPPPSSYSTNKPQPQQPATPAAPSPPPAPAAPANVGPSLEAQVMEVLQARGGAAEGVTIDECVRALSGKVSRAAVEACLVGLEESFLAYRGPGGGFKLL